MADRLSRFPSRRENLPIELHNNIQHIGLTTKITITRGATEKDPILHTVYCITPNGCPHHICEALCIVCHFWGARDKLTVDIGLLLKAVRVWIPSKLYQRMLHDLHDGHKGVKKMQHLARDRIYWQGLDADITEYVKHCKMCTMHKATQSIEPMLPRDIPEGPWQLISSTITMQITVLASTPSYTKFHKKQLTLYSRRLNHLFPGIDPLKRLTTDNWPAFISEALKKFLQDHHTDHITSSPNYPKSNGFTECQIKMIKTALSHPKWFDSQ